MLSASEINAESESKSPNGVGFSVEEKVICQWEIGYQGPEGDVKSKAQINNNLLTSIYEKLLKMGGVEEEEFSLLSPYIVW